MSSKLKDRVIDTVKDSCMITLTLVLAVVCLGLIFSVNNSNVRVVCTAVLSLQVTLNLIELALDKRLKHKNSDKQSL